MFTDVSSLMLHVNTALLETAYMVILSLIISIILGGLLGLLLFVTSNPLFFQNHAVNHFLSSAVNIVRSLPFLILMIFVLPLSKIIVGTKIGPDAVIVPLSIATIAFFARLAEVSFSSVNHGVLEAYIASGASELSVIFKILLPEAATGLIKNVTITTISVIGSSAMAGLVGGGGLGDLAYRYGYQQYRTDVMIACVVLLVILVQMIQIIGDNLANARQKKRS